MTFRTLHLVVGIAGVAAFFAAGALLGSRFPDPLVMNELLRWLARSNHVYVLLAGLVNVALAVQLAPVTPGWRSAASRLASLLALAAPAVLCLAFYLEAARAPAERVVTLLGVSALAAGIALHVLGGARRHGLG